MFLFFFNRWKKYPKLEYGAKSNVVDNPAIFWHTFRLFTPSLLPFVSFFKGFELFYLIMRLPIANRTAVILEIRKLMCTVLSDSPFWVFFVYLNNH